MHLPGLCLPVCVRGYTYPGYASLVGILGGGDIPPWVVNWCIIASLGVYTLVYMPSRVCIPWCICPPGYGRYTPPGYVPLLHLPGTPSRLPTLLRCTGNPARTEVTALAHTLAETNIRNAALTVAGVTVPVSLLVVVEERDIRMRRVPCFFWERDTVAKRASLPSTTRFTVGQTSVRRQFLTFCQL